MYSSYYCDMNKTNVIDLELLVPFQQHSALRRELGNKIKSIRKDKHYSQTQLANRIYSTAKCISKIEAGQQKLKDPTNLQLIFDVFHMDVNLVLKEILHKYNHVQDSNVNLLRFTIFSSTIKNTGVLHSEKQVYNNISSVLLCLCFSIIVARLTIRQIDYNLLININKQLIKTVIAILYVSSLLMLSFAYAKISDSIMHITLKALKALGPWYFVLLYIDNLIFHFIFTHRPKIKNSYNVFVVFVSICFVCLRFSLISAIADYVDLTIQINILVCVSYLFILRFVHQKLSTNTKTSY